jgi:hypothetical protein
MNMQTIHESTPDGLIFPPQYPFSWTLRGARADRLRVEGLAERLPTEESCAKVSYRIAGSISEASQLAAAIAYCDEHGALLELQ